MNIWIPHIMPPSIGPIEHFAPAIADTTRAQVGPGGSGAVGPELAGDVVDQDPASACSSVPTIRCAVNGLLSKGT